MPINIPAELLQPSVRFNRILKIRLYAEDFEWTSSEGVYDLSDSVLRWPTIRYAWNLIRPTEISISLASLNPEVVRLLKAGYTQSLLEVQVALQIAGASGDPWILFTGSVIRFSLTKTEALLQMQDIGKFLTSYNTGNVSLSANSISGVHNVSGIRFTLDSERSVVLQGSYNPADLAWMFLVEAALLDNDTTINEDIDLVSFNRWKAGWQRHGNTVLTGLIKNMSIAEVLAEIARYTFSAIYLEHGRIHFAFRGTSTERNAEPPILNDLIINYQFSYTTEKMVQLVHFYRKSAAGEPTAETASNSSALDEYDASGSKEIAANSVWFSSSQPARSVAQQMLQSLQAPTLTAKLVCSMAAATYLIGTVVKIHINHSNFREQGMHQHLWRIESRELDIQKGRVLLQLARVPN